MVLNSSDVRRELFQITAESDSVSRSDRRPTIIATKKIGRSPNFLNQLGDYDRFRESSKTNLKSLTFRSEEVDNGLHIARSLVAIPKKMLD
jgi:hypothetical protein